MGLILSPCILPILPLILATGIQGGKLRPYGIIFGFISIFVLFTLFARTIFSTLNVNPMLIQDVTIYLILAFGIILFSDTLSNKFSSFFQRLANLGQTLSEKAEVHLPQGFWSGVLIGGGIALIWTPCAGPIMAAVLVQTIQQKTDYQATLILTTFSIGVALPMLIITVFSKRIIEQVRLFSHHTKIVRKTLASIIIVTMLFTKFNVWQKITTIESPPLASIPLLPATHLIKSLENPYPAPKIEGIKKWINSPPLNLEELKKQGKVVLIDFWTYSCINCVRTLPYIKSWYDKYHDKGLVIIGVHSPEFEFEKNEQNVETAVKKDGIQYPVAMDNDLVTWENFNNRYWPAHYLINQDGKVVYIHFGENEYDVTENNIRYLLGLEMEKNYKTSQPELPSPISPSQSPETYLGYGRTEGFVSPQNMEREKTARYTYPKHIPLNSWALQGFWLAQSEKIIAKEPKSSLQYHFRAKQVYLVMAPSTPGVPQKVKVLFNGKPVMESAGKDVKNSQVLVNQSTLYELVSFKELTSGIIEIQAETPGLEAFAFTFGAI
ncbi:MAG: redoxin family protein [Alphaproteobacteria bacterium]|nr:redoxin family protein [Alphaproteobacteria bacterium]